MYLGTREGPSRPHLRQGGAVRLRAVSTYVPPYLVRVTSPGTGKLPRTSERHAGHETDHRSTCDRARICSGGSRSRRRADSVRCPGTPRHTVGDRTGRPHHSRTRRTRRTTALPPGPATASHSGLTRTTVQRRPSPTLQQKDRRHDSVPAAKADQSTLRSPPTQGQPRPPPPGA